MTKTYNRRPSVHQLLNSSTKCVDNTSHTKRRSPLQGTKRLGSTQPYHSRVYCKNSMENKRSEPRAGTSKAAWEIICFSPPQPKLLLCSFSWRCYKVESSHSLWLERLLMGLLISHGHCYALLIIFSELCNPPLHFPKHNMPTPHGPWAGPKYYLGEHRSVCTFWLQASNRTTRNCSQEPPSLYREAWLITQAANRAEWNQADTTTFRDLI